MHAVRPRSPPEGHRACCAPGCHVGAKGRRRAGGSLRAASRFWPRSLAAAWLRPRSRGRYESEACMAQPSRTLRREADEAHRMLEGGKSCIALLRHSRVALECAASERRSPSHGSM
eukprot:6183804-Pleurochrysis_carterae.AAC.1